MSAPASVVEGESPFLQTKKPASQQVGGRGRRTRKEHHDVIAKITSSFALVKSSVSLKATHKVLALTWVV